MLRRLIRPTTRRNYSTQNVQLAFNKRSPKSPAEKKWPPLVILHGLFGSKQNWKSLSGAFANKLNTDVYALDLRNHGDSPHTEVHTYESMAADVGDFLRQQSLQDAILMGHSMGGKVAMSVALSDPKILGKLIVVDVAPIAGPLSGDFATYVKGMKEIEALLSKPEGSHPAFRKSDGDTILQKYEQDIGVRQFLLTNLVRDVESGKMHFRVPLDILGRSLDVIGGFPHTPGLQHFDGPTLFVRGTKSRYVKDGYFDTIRGYFPRYKLAELPTGHWVHAEKPSEFLDVVTNFITDSM